MKFFRPPFRPHNIPAYRAEVEKNKPGVIFVYSEASVAMERPLFLALDVVN